MMFVTNPTVQVFRSDRNATTLTGKAQTCGSCARGLVTIRGQYLHTTYSAAVLERSQLNGPHTGPWLQTKPYMSFLREASFHTQLFIKPRVQAFKNALNSTDLARDPIHANVKKKHDTYTRDGPKRKSWGTQKESKVKDLGGHTYD